MKIAGIVAEYNPFHNGHAFQIAKTREAGATHIVAVMGGNYLQRGSAAQFEKHIRTEAALHCGADLIIELPLPYALSTAERFAAGALTLMQALGCIDMVCFGAESALEQLQPLANALLADELAPRIKYHLSLGVTFAKARQLALEEHFSKEQAAVIASPNNILGIEYLKAAKRFGFTPEFCTVQRKGTAHDSEKTNGAFASASMLRNLMNAQGLIGLRPYVPAQAYEIYRRAQAEGLVPADFKKAECALLAVLRRMNPEEFSALPDISEGLENRLYTAIRRADTVENLQMAVKSKRYPLARIRRLILSAYLGITEEDALISPPYLRVLGFNKNGLDILNRAKKSAALPLSSSLAQLERVNSDCRRIAKLEASSTDLYALTLPNILPCGYDYTCKPVMLK